MMREQQKPTHNGLFSLPGGPQGVTTINVFFCQSEVIHTGASSLLIHYVQAVISAVKHSVFLSHRKD